MAPSRTSVPDNMLMWASHDSPPNVGDSTKADTTSRPLSLMSAERRVRAPASSVANAGRSQLIAPYDSTKTRNTSAPRRCARFDASTGAGPSSRIPAPLISWANCRACRAHTSVTGVAIPGHCGTSSMRR